jgi:hypothetical protein
MECPFHRGVCLGASGWLRVGSESGCIRHRSTSRPDTTRIDRGVLRVSLTHCQAARRDGVELYFVLFLAADPNFLVSHLRKFSE